MSRITEFELAIVIPTFNRKELTLSCIRKLRASSICYKIFVSDSSSSDGTQEAVSSEENICLQHAGSDAWWSEAINLGIQSALDEGFTCILILNDDIEFEQDLVSRLLEKHYEYPDSIISPIQESPTGTFLGIRYIGMIKKMHLINYSANDIVVDTTNGCCLLVPCKIFKSVGLIDSKNCPHQYGDTEFQLRVKHAGFSIIGCPSIRIKQLDATDYFLRLRLFSIFSFKGSPLYIRAYLKFGKTLFSGCANFFILGILYHFSYIKVLLKAVFFFSKRSLGSIVSLNYFI